MPDQTPEQREAALKLAKRIGTGIFHCEYDESVQLARAYTNLHAENVRLREALDDAPHEEGCAYIGSLLRFDKFNGRKLPTVPCNCWKSRAALSGSPDTEADPKE